MIEGMRHAPMWPGLEAVAPTLLYDAAVMGDSLVPAGLGEAVKVPTLVLTGSKTGQWAAKAATALTRVLPGALHRTLQGQDHNVAWDVLAPELWGHFGSFPVTVKNVFRSKASARSVFGRHLPVTNSRYRSTSRWPSR
jgi:hypothetical protein